MRIIVLLFIIVILFSLGSALYYLVKDKGQSERVVRALTVRITFSIALFLLLMLGFYFGLISPQGL
ncbi:MAG TPA: twin transmembrane helix small protein [Burkholderiales bacterium]|nr:twin transmembrane helix small protein [Burkholderiales bacterium]